MSTSLSMSKSTYELPELEYKWERSELTAEQMIEQLLLWSQHHEEASKVCQRYLDAQERQLAEQKMLIADLKARVETLEDSVLVLGSPS